MYSPFAYDPYETTGSSYYSPLSGYLAAPHIFNPSTYGQYAPDTMAMMRTPYGGAFQTPMSNNYYAAMIAHPFKSFLTYKVPLYMAPAGLNPVLFDTYANEAKAQGTIGTAGFVAGSGMSLALGAVGASFAGPIGGIAGSLLGEALGNTIMAPLNTAAGRIIQTHEAANLLNVAGAGKYGFGISMGQATKLYKDFTASAVEHPRFSPEEQQLAFNELARNSMIDDSGDFGEVEMNIKKMKNVVEKLRDLFNGSIKQTIQALRQLNLSGISSEDFVHVTAAAGVAAANKGQTTADYINNTVNTAQITSNQTGFSKGTMFEVKTMFDSTTDIVGNAVKQFYKKGLSNKDRVEKFQQDFIRSMSALGMNGNVLLANKAMSPQQYVLTALEAGIQKYNKDVGEHLTLRDVINNKQLQEKIMNRYGVKELQKLEQQYNGDYNKIFNYLANKDSSYYYDVLDFRRTANDVKRIDSKKVLNLISSYLPNMSSKLKDLLVHKKLGMLNPEEYDSTLKLLDIYNNNPDLFEKIFKTSEQRTEKAIAKDRWQRLKAENSFQAVFRRVKYNFQKSMATLVSWMPGFGEDETFKPLNTKVAQGKIGKYYNALNKLGSVKLDDMLVRGYFPSSFEGNVFSALRRTFVGSEDERDVSNRMQDLLGGQWFSYNKEDFPHIWAAAKHRRRAMEHMYRTIDSWSKGDEEATSVLAAYFSKKRTEDETNSAVTNIGATDEFKNYFKKLTQTITEINNAIKEAKAKIGASQFEAMNSDDVREGLLKKLNFNGSYEEMIEKAHSDNNLKSKIIKTYEKAGLDQKQANALFEYEFNRAKKQKTINEMKTIYTADEAGIVGVLRQMGYKGDIKYDDIKDISEALSENAIFRKKFTESLMKSNHISKEAATKVVNYLTKYGDKDANIRADVLSFNQISQEDYMEVFKKDNIVSNMFKKGAAIETLKAMQAYKNNFEDFYKDIKFLQENEEFNDYYGSSENSKKIMNFMMSRGHFNNKEQLDAITKVYTSLRDYFDKHGKLDFNGRTYMSFKEFVADEPMFKLYTKKILSAGFASQLSKKLGIDAYENPEDIMKLIKGAFKYDEQTGKFTLKSKEELDKNFKDLPALLKKLHLGESYADLGRIESQLNGDNSLKQTNSWLQSIYRVLEEIKNGDEKNSKIKNDNIKH